MLTATKLSSDRYMLKLAVTQSGTNADDTTITAAALILLMDDGPLKTLWSTIFANSAAAKAALQDGVRGEVVLGSQAASAAGAPAWSAVVDTAGNAQGQGQLNLHGDPAGSPYVVELSYRHSTGR